MLSNPHVLDCHKCFIPLTPPVYQCENGNFICAQCSINTRNKCPNCCTPIKNNPCRGIEMILQSVQTPSQYTQRGCQAKLSYALKPSHEKYCQYVSCSCPMLGCSYVNMSFDLYNHFGIRHPNSFRTFNFNSTLRIILSRMRRQLVSKNELAKYFLCLIVNMCLWEI